jgi:hypothetical protein
MFILSVPMWVLAVWFLARDINGHPTLPEEIFTLTVAACLTLSATMVWCCGQAFGDASASRGFDWLRISFEVGRKAERIYRLAGRAQKVAAVSSPSGDRY